MQTPDVGLMLYHANACGLVVTPEGMITLFPKRKNLFGANKLETAFCTARSKIRFLEMATSQL